jgi:hypothetical protein
MEIFDDIVCKLNSIEFKFNSKEMGYKIGICTQFVNWNLYQICTNLLLILPFKLVWKWRLNGSLDWLQPETLKVFQVTHNLEVQFQTFGVPIFISFFRNVEITFHSSVYFTTKISPNFFFQNSRKKLKNWREVISISKSEEKNLPDFYIYWVFSV